MSKRKTREARQLQVMGLAGILPLDYTYLLAPSTSVKSALDILGSPPDVHGDPAAPGFEHEGYRRSGGGKIANILCYLAKSGHEVGVCGAVGDDAAGRAILEEMERDGVHADWVETRSNKITRRVFILHKLEKAHSKQTHNHISAPVFPRNLVQTLPIPAVILAGRASGYVKDYLHRARCVSACTLSFHMSDVPWRTNERDMLFNLLGGADVLVLDKDAGGKLCGVSRASASPWEVVEAAGKLSRARLIVYFAGSNGVFAQHIKTRLSVTDGSYVDVLDPTGMGDCFHAALISFLLQGSWQLDNADLVKGALRFGNEMAGFCGSGIGARHYPIMNQVEDMRRRYWAQMDARVPCFISHSSSDASFVSELALKLNSVPGVKTWVNGVGAGNRIKRTIEAAIQDSDIFVLILSGAAISSEWVREEVVFALKQQKLGRLKVVPVVIEGGRDDEVKRLWSHACQSFGIPDRLEEEIAYLDGRPSRASVEEVAEVVLRAKGENGEGWR